MIAFDFNGSEPLNLVLMLFLVVLGGTQAGLLLRTTAKTISKQKTAIRWVLNVLLWLIVAGFIVQPVFRSTRIAGAIIVAGKDVPSNIIKSIQDSLHIQQVFSESGLKGKAFDTLMLVGQEFSPSFISNLSQQLNTTAVVRRIPYHSDNQILSVSWKGLIRKGQEQRITGRVNTQDKQWIKVKFGSQTLDSTQVEKGTQSFRLSFPVFTERRTYADLYLGEDRYETIPFFARPLPPMTFQFILDHPDFESRNLATWLANRGHAVEISTNLSKDIISRLTLNKAGLADVIVTDPANASHSQVKKALANGKSILFINLVQGSSDVAAVNTALGTSFQVKKISNQEVLPVNGALTRLPFDFALSNSSLKISAYPVAVEKTSGKVAVSLLNETFPVLLNGDSTTYSHIWTAVLAAVHPAYLSNAEVMAPVYKGIQTSLQWNHLPGNPSSVALGRDTMQLAYSAINRQSAVAQFVPTDTSWQTLGESEIYVADRLHFNHYYKSLVLDDFVRSRMKMQSALNDTIKTSAGTSTVNERRIPDWIWFWMFLVCLTALWLEPKFN